MKINSFLKKYFIYFLVVVSVNASPWSLSYYQTIQTHIESDVKIKMDLQIEEVEALRKFYEEEIKERIDSIKENKTKINKQEIQLTLLLKKIAKKEEQIKRLLK